MLLMMVVVAVVPLWFVGHLRSFIFLLIFALAAVFVRRDRREVSVGRVGGVVVHSRGRRRQRRRGPSGGRRRRLWGGDVVVSLLEVLRLPQRRHSHVQHLLGFVPRNHLVVRG